MDLILAITMAATVMLAAALSSSGTTHPAQHRSGVGVADIRARIAAERECAHRSVRRW
ncbi:hypothetical protein ACFYUD_27715 [Nocardia tengchongensis]|uniref:hypothetical protein n=1 Tax=Nocardia tengchongensis TaxID=2055889 RepID=UPI0036777E97